MTMHHHVLALDLASRTGWAVSWGHDDHPPISGTWDITPRRGESPGVRYLRLRAHLEETLRAFPGLQLVVYEQAHQRGGAPTEYAFGCIGHVQSWCAEHGLEHAAVHTAQVKRRALGTAPTRARRRKGDPPAPRMDRSKDAVLAAARARWPWCQTDDEADALWALDWALHELLAAPQTA